MENISSESSESVNGDVDGGSERPPPPTDTLHSVDESEDRKATRRALTAMGIPDDVVTHFMDRLGSNLEVIANAIYDERDAE
jgi:hypothetical protein